ncbi:porin PorA family protein [Gordonia sp. CPCC 206044]|uniref:porin PorA family protein n=1 Tax=Gordonia sp. CPCC 206044 TaxID=3140793 RepID=UPI003AF3689A
MQLPHADGASSLSLLRFRFVLAHHCRIRRRRDTHRRTTHLPFSRGRRPTTVVVDAGCEHAVTALPAYQWGMRGRQQVEMYAFYTNVQDVWVEPTTGATVMVQSHPRTYFARSADDQYAVDVFNGSVRFDSKTESAMVTKAGDGRTKLRAVGVYFPWTAGIAGVLIIVMAVLWIRRRPTRAVREHETAHPGATEATLVVDPVRGFDEGTHAEQPRPASR